MYIYKLYISISTLYINIVLKCCSHSEAFLFRNIGSTAIRRFSDKYMLNIKFIYINSKANLIRWVAGLSQSGTHDVAFVLV